MTVKNHFRHFPHQTYFARFDPYLEKYGMKKQKLHKIDDYICDTFERAQEKILRVDDIDLRQWALKKAIDESLHSSVASNH